MQEKDQWFPRVRREEGINRYSTEDFYVEREKILCDPVTVNTCHYTFVQTHRMYTTKSEP